MDNNNIQKLRETLAKNNNFAVVTGQNPSLDEMAATLSLYLMLKNAEKKVTIACPTPPIVEISSLVGIDRVQTTLGGEASDLVVSFPYVEGEIEKVSYTLEDGYLNIIVKAAEQGLSFDEKDVKYTRGSGKIDVLFVVGTPQLSDLGNLFDSEKLKNIKIVNIDNKPENPSYGDIAIVSTRLSSVSEQIADLALALGFRIDKDIAQNLLSGITTATKNFQDAATSPMAFEMAALLLKKGASRVHDTAARESILRREDKRDENRNPQPNNFTPRRDDNRPAHHDQRREENRHPQPARPRFQNDQRGRNNQPFQDRPQKPFQERNQPQPEEPTQFNLTPTQQQPEIQPEEKEDNAPVDWLTPKVYKGSSNF